MVWKGFSTPQNPLFQPSPAYTWPYPKAEGQAGKRQKKEFRHLIL